MRLDRTKIAIRERSLLDILDMSLRVMMTFGKPLLCCFVVFVAPLMLLNWWLLSGMTEVGETVDANFSYCWTMALMVFIESPLVSLFATPFLGNAMFLDDTNWKKIAATVGSSAGALSWTLLILRGILFAWWLGWAIHSGGGTENQVLLTILAILVASIRSSRPFIIEVILLERNPMFSRDAKTITMGRRSSALHGPNVGDLISRWVGAALIALLLTISIFFSCWFFWGMLLFDWNWGAAMLDFWYPLSLWIVAAYMSIVRFMSYLDLRIRREGWEVELIVRAAANGLTGAAA